MAGADQLPAFFVIVESAAEMGAAPRNRPGPGSGVKNDEFRLKDETALFQGLDDRDQTRGRLDMETQKTEQRRGKTSQDHKFEKHGEETAPPGEIRAGLVFLINRSHHSSSLHESLPQLLADMVRDQAADIATMAGRVLDDA